MVRNRMGDNPIIEFSSVSKGFQNKLVFNNLNFSVSKGESVCLIGTSGSGKTLLVKSAIGLVRPTGGIIKIDGQDNAKH